MQIQVEAQAEEREEKRRKDGQLRRKRNRYAVPRSAWARLPTGSTKQPTNRSVVSARKGLIASLVVGV